MKNLVAPRYNFLGTFAKDQVPSNSSLTRFPCCFISNTDNSNQPGEHWVAFWFDSKDSSEFFDSYGYQPSIFGFILLCNHFNRTCIQSLHSNVCGQYCLFYLFWKSRGKSLSLIVHCFDPKSPGWNDSQVRKYVRKALSLSLHSVNPPNSQSSIPRKHVLSRKSLSFSSFIQ